jgi:hypothetical protein
MKAYGGVEVYVHSLLTEASRCSRFTPGELAPGRLWIKSRIGPRAGLDIFEISVLVLPGMEESFLGRPFRSLVTAIYSASNSP